jgi:hypothetical protein
LNPVLQLREKMPIDLPTELTTNSAERFVTAMCDVAVGPDGSKFNPATSGQGD